MRTLCDLILELANEPEWESQARSMCQEADVEDLTIQAATVSYLEARLGKLRGMAEDMSDPLDEPDLRAALIYWYIEAKCEWCQINQRLNYQTMLGKIPDQLLLMQGGIGTAVLARVEAFVGQSETESINDFLSSPLDNAIELIESRDMKLSEGCYEIEQSLRSSLTQTLEKVEEFQFTLAAVRNHPDGIRLASNQYEVLVTAAQSQLRELNDFRGHVKSLRRKITELARLKGIRVLPEFEIEATANLDGPRVEALMELVDVWIDELFAHGLESDPRSRVDSGKAAHVSIAIRLATEGKHVTLTVNDDGLALDSARTGTYHSLPDWPAGSFGGGLRGLGRLKGILDWDLTLEEGIQFGSCLKFRIPTAPRLNARNYIVTMCGGQQFAIDSDRVATIVPLGSTSIQATQTNPKVVLDGQTHDVVRLDRKLSLASTEEQDFMALVCLTMGRPLALLVDQVDTLHRGICRPMDSHAIRLAPQFRGILETDNGCCLVLDLDEVLAA